MAWVVGELRLLSGSDRFFLIGKDGSRRELTSGSGLELWHDHRWQRGRVEYSDRRGYHWTNDRDWRRLGVGDDVRVWSGRDWPAERVQAPVRQGGHEQGRSLWSR